MVDHSLHVINENLRKINEDIITLVKPGENKRVNESLGDSRRKIVSD